MNDQVKMLKRGSGLCLLLFYCFNTSLLAQRGDVPISRPKYRFPQKTGLTVGVGINVMNLDKLNQRLEELRIGQVDPFLTAGHVGLYSGNDNLAASLDVTIANASDNTLVRPDSTSLSFGTFSMGMSMYYSLLRARRVDLLFALGFRYTDMWFEYTVNTHFPTGFNAVLGSPTNNSTTVRLRNSSNVSVPVGGRFQFQVGNQSNRQGREFKVGIDAGYVVSVINNNWRRAGSGGLIQDMPETKPGNFYFYLTFSGFLKRCT